MDTTESASGNPFSTIEPAQFRYRERAVAAGIHLLISLAVATAVLGLVFWVWYPEPLDRLSGVGAILVLLLAIDVVLGPVLTAVVFDRRKRSLRFDLACIGVLQLAALAYGLYTVEAGRAHHLVFVKDRFEAVSRADLRSEDMAIAANNPYARASWFGPRFVAAEFPADGEARQQLMFESVLGGRDLHHLPAQYRALDSQSADMRAKSLPLADLRTFNPGRGRDLDAALAKLGVEAHHVRFLPLKGPEGDAAVLIDAAHGNVLLIVDLMPWE